MTELGRATNEEHHGLLRGPGEASVSWWRDGPAMRREIGLLLWAVLLFDVVIAGLGYSTRDYFEDWSLAVTLGLTVFITVAFLLILGTNVLGAALVDLVRAARCWWGRRR